MFEENFLNPIYQCACTIYAGCCGAKRALGNKYNAGVEALSAFDDFCNEQQLRIPAISKELLQKWEKRDLTKTKPRNVFGFVCANSL